MAQRGQETGRRSRGRVRLDEWCASSTSDRAPWQLSSSTASNKHGRLVVLCAPGRDGLTQGLKRVHPISFVGLVQLVCFERSPCHLVET